MAKLKSVDTQELKAVDDAASDLIQTVRDLTNRIEKTYSQSIDDPIGLARTFTALSRTSSEMVTMLLSNYAIQEQRKEIERMTAERDRLKA